MKSVRRRSMMRCLRTTWRARSVPAAVRIASLCAPRSTSPSASSRLSISPAEARETPSISATRDASVGEPDVCVGVNSVVPARGGDVVKLYLVKQRLRNASYATLAPTLIVETLFDAVVASALLIWALSLGVLPTEEVYSRIPTVDWRFFIHHD